MVTKEKKENIINFFGLVLAGIILSMLLKNEILWDLANYHYYNAFAFLNDRSALDVVPANVNTFFNPIMDLPLHFYIEYFNDYPNILYALQGIWFGLFLFTLYKICLLFFEGKNNNISSFFVLVLTTTGQATFCQIGTSSNEIPVSFFILWGLYILLKQIKLPETQKLKKFFAAGLIMGIALGLKQTVVIYCIASGLMLMICYKYLNKPYKSIFFFALGGFIAYIALNGWFMWKYWTLYGNPFFPFLNGVFHSPYFFDLNYRDAKFIPSLSEFLIFPFLWYFKPFEISEVPYYDLRLSLYYVLLIVTLLVLLIKGKTKTFYLGQKLQTALGIFVFLGFFIWMGLFSIMRYTVVIEAMGALIFVSLFEVYDKDKHKILFICQNFLMTGLILLVFFHSTFGHAYGTHISMQEIELPENTLIKIYGMPTSFVIPIMAKKHSFKTVSYYRKCTKENIVCFNGQGSDFTEYGRFLEKRNEIEKNHKGPVIYIYDERHLNIFQTKEQLKQYYQKALGLCQQAIRLNYAKDIHECMESTLYKYINDYAVAEKYVSYEDIVYNYACQKLTNNLNSKLKICVPKELKAQIFKNNPA